MWGDDMTKLKDYYKGDMPCKECIHKNVCNVKKCFEETENKTTHPFVDIIVKCSEFHPIINADATIPQQKAKHWITLEDEWGYIVEAVCPYCDYNGNHTWNYCPNCGKEIAKKEGEKND